MQFVAGGPDVPASLLEAHEEGRVVFFCGAGISYAAGLPGFKGLVDAIYESIGTSPSASEQAVYDRCQFDATLDLLERRVPGQRLAIRKALMQALQPNLEREGAADAHDALLQLGRGREGVVRLVTTNFDRIFAHLTASATPIVPAHAAPMLPIPKSSRWSGVVYLHGLLPEGLDAAALNRLVLTSGDFGLAYLTERWAARFVSELLRNYVVCFVGYSINDPVLRYMMDALAADRMLGETTLPSYALGDCNPGEEKSKTTEWEAKGVVPILYEVPAGTDDHSALRRTLKAWAETYRDGILGVERIVVELAMTQPSASTPQDNFVARMRWALSHESGVPAKRFADFDPAPSLEWLKVLSEECYSHKDLPRFGVPPHQQSDEELKFSLVRRPAPPSHSPWMTLVSPSVADSGWDSVMGHLAGWLVRHLDDPSLVLWLVQSGGHLNSRLLLLIDEKLGQFSRLEREGKEAEIHAIQAQAPSAIPRPAMRLIWRLFLARRVKSSPPDTNLYRWSERLKRDGLTVSLRFGLREALAAKIPLRRPLRARKGSGMAPAQDTLRQLFDWELVLTADHVYSFLKHVAGVEQWRHALPEFVEFNGRTIAATPLAEFTLEHAEHVLRQPTLSEGSVRHIAQVLHRVLSLAVYPARVLEHSPLPRGWSPRPNPVKARSYLFPSEDAAMLANTKVPLVRRIFLGFCAREGPRVTNVVRLQWADLTLEVGPGRSGRAVVDKTKTGEHLHWVLDPGTTEALRRWKLICPSEVWVFPSDAVPRSSRARRGGPMAIGSIAVHLRKALEEADVHRREQLYQRSAYRLRLRAHDLRATFITLALAMGRSEDWVRLRTGHRTSQMIARYRLEAKTAHELELGWFQPLHEVLPELAALGPVEPSAPPELSANCRHQSEGALAPSDAVLH